jgi:hypothetical protein
MSAQIIDQSADSQAERFLSLIDPDETTWHFRAIVPKEDERPDLYTDGVAVCTPFSNMTSLSRLRRLNASGCGAYVVINAGGNKASDITRVRALWVDFDKADDGHLSRLSTLVPFEPSIIVESSPGKHHAYWLVEDVPLDKFKDAQLKLIALLGSDKAINDLPRVMRMPGFIHTKDVGCVFETRMISEPGYVYDWSEFSAFLDSLPAVAESGAGAAAAEVVEGDFSEGGRNVALFKHLCSKRSRGWSEEEMLFYALAFNIAHCKPPLPNEEVATIVQQVGQYVKGVDRPAPLTEAQIEARREAQREAYRREGEGGEGLTAESLNTVAYTLEDMLAQFIYLEDGGRVFNTLAPSCVLTLADFRNATAGSVAKQKDQYGKLKVVPVAQLWLNSPLRRSAFSTTFLAGGALEVLDPEGRKCVNTWSGWRFPRIEGGDATLFVEHVRFLFEDRADDFLDWLAHIAQRPGELPHTAWLHVATSTGMGRNTLAGILSKVFAGYCASALDLVGMLGSGFNGRLARKVLAVVDEIREGGANKWAHAEAFKQIITANVREINPKFGRRSEEHNACRFLIFSNHRSALPLDHGDRRVEVAVTDAVPRSAEYYCELGKAIDTPAFISAVAHFLLARDLSGFNPFAHAEMGVGKQQVIAAAVSEEDSALADAYTEYPFELITGSRLQAYAGVTVTSQNAKAFGMKVESAGWVRVGRFPEANGAGKKSVYARRCSAAAWHGLKQKDYLAALPAEDGGSAGALGTFL